MVRRQSCKLKIPSSILGEGYYINNIYNQINIISLDDVGFDEQSLPIVVCRGMASIPLYFSSYKRGKILSLEHTHPPASLVVHGNRFGAQKQLKDYWLSQLKK